MRFLILLLIAAASQAAGPAEDYARLHRLMYDALRVEEKDQAAVHRVLLERFPLGTSYDDVLKEVRKVRRAFRYNSEYLEESNRSVITLTLFIYFEHGEDFGKEEFEVYLKFGDSDKLIDLLHSRGSRPL
jgi:hypothetical protein